MINHLDIQQDILDLANDLNDQLNAYKENSEDFICEQMICGSLYLMLQCYQRALEGDSTAIEVLYGACDQINETVLKEPLGTVH